MFKKDKKKRRLLISNKPAMLAVKYMARAGLSCPQIKKELERAFKFPWSTSCIARNIRLLSNPQTAATAEKKVTVTPPPTSQQRVTRLFAKTNPSKLDFGGLCEYTASFFAPVSAIRGRAPRILWESAKAKARQWHELRSRTRSDDFASFTETQNRAYDFCSDMYIDASTKNGVLCSTLHDLYRRWQKAFIQDLDE